MTRKLHLCTRWALAIAIASLLSCSASWASTLTNDLLFHLTFDDTNYLDDSGNSINGTAVGNPLIVPGFIGKGAVSVTTKSDGSEFDYVTLGYPAQLDLDTTVSFSISFWTSYTNQMDDPPFISNKNWNSSGNPGWGIFTQNGGNFRVNVTDQTSSSDKENTENTPVIRDGKWHHVCVTFDRVLQVVTVYVDGKFYSSDPSMANVTGDIDTGGLGDNVNIGQDGTGGYNDGGSAQMIGLMMDDMGMWSRVLSPSEVTAIYQGGLAGSNILQVVTKLLPFANGFSPASQTVGAPASPVISAVINDADTAVVPSTVALSLDGTTLAATVTKSSNLTSVVYATTNLLAPASTHTVSLSFSDNATPVNQVTTNWTFTVLNYPTIPASGAQPANAVSTNGSNIGFQMRVSQISASQIEANDGTTTGFLPGSVARAEAQLAGVLTDPMTGLLQPEVATPGPLTNGAYPISGVLNFSTFGADQGNFTSANGHPKTTTPGLDGSDDDNSAVEFVGYLYLPAGFYQFGANSADGFRMTIGTNAYDAFSTQVGLYDVRSIPFNTTFSFAVAQTGFYATRIVWFREHTLPDNIGSAGFELYTISPAGQKTLVNDATSTNAIMAYQSSSAPYGPYVKYAGPTSFVSTYRGNDWGSPTVTVQIHDGSSSKVTPSSIRLSLDGAPVNATVTNSGGITTVTYTPPGLQLKRTVHTGQITYSAGSTPVTDTWQFNSLRSYILPAPVYFENFDELADGQLPANWSQVNYTTPETTNSAPSYSDPNSDSFLGWVVLNTGDGAWSDWTLNFNVGLYQELNGRFFDFTTNTLLSNQFLFSESDVRSGQQIQYVYTQKYNLSGKVGTVVAFNSSYEQNQNNIDGLEYSLDGTNWQPVVYLLMGINDAQQNAQIVYDANGIVNVAQTMAFPINPHYTNSSGKVVGGNLGAFIGAPITQAIEPYIEGRVNDDAIESMRFEAYNVPAADNQPAVQFRLLAVGTGSWFWGIDNWGIYSVPSLVSSSGGGLGSLTAELSGNNLVLTWTAGANVVLQQNTNLGTTNWTTVSGTAGLGTYSVPNIPSQASTFYRLAQP